MSELTIPMFEELPMDNPEALKKKRKAFNNILYGQINRLMNHLKIEMVEIHKATGTPFPTLSGWINGNVEAQMLDSSIKQVANFFGVSVDYLAYATPMTDRDLELEDAMPDFDYGDGFSKMEQVISKTSA